MKRGAKISTWIILGVVAVPLAAIVTFMYALSDLCGNYPHKEYFSPNGQYSAVIFQRDCGATTGFSTQISILGRGQELENEAGNIYVIDAHPDDVAPDLIWESNEELTILRQLNGSESLSATEWGLSKLVKVRYRAGNS